MSFFSTLRSNRGTILVLSLLALVTAIFSLPFILSTRAADVVRTDSSHNAGLPNYDIRSDKGAIFTLATYRDAVGKSAVDVADIRDEFVAGEEALRQSVPTLKIEYNTDIRTPEVIAPDVKQGKAFLSTPTSQKRSDVLKAFLRENSELVGVRSSDITELKVAADYTNPDGNLSFVELNQEINGIPVFRGEVKAGFTKAGEIIRVINNLAPRLDGAPISTDFGDAGKAVIAAVKHINLDATKLDAVPNKSASTSLKTVFGASDTATTAEKMYFPTEPGVVVPAWRVLVWLPVNAYYVIVDANGTMLWRKNITEDQTQTATYSVYANPNAMVNIAHSPFPFSPGPISPAGQQGSLISRSMITRIGNEAPYTFNNLGWIPDGSFITDGNAVQAGLDRDGTNGIDPNSEAFSNTRLFSFDYNPFNPNTGTGDTPFPTPQTYPGSAFQQGMITQLFYTANWFHDETYRLGFTEAARNFQNVNFTGQGIAGDRVSAEGQDSSGFNNANFSSGADGVRGRMQMFFFSGPNPDIDGSLDSDVVIHEHMHGVSNRLHGNSAGLFNDMSRGMGEGWSDFYGMAMLSTPADPIDSLATNGAYVTYLFQGETNNAYYGIRRFPTAIKTSLGGPNSRPHNPLTFADIDVTQMNISDGAFAPRSVSGNSDAVHNAGEIWCVALWEIRARMIQRLGWSVGNRRILQLVMDGMKLAPLSPTPISERDAIVAAAFATGEAGDLADIWAGFAARGLGASASIQHLGGTSIGGTGTARVTEAFDLPNLYQTPALTVSDFFGDNDGYPEPGENVRISIPLTNATGQTATAITLQLVGGGTANYGNLLSGLLTSRDLAYTVPLSATCGSTITLTLQVNSSLGPVSFTRQIFIGKPGTTTQSENFDGVTTPALPALWTAVPEAGGVNFVSSTTTPDSAPNAMFALNPTTVGGGTILSPPPVSVTSATSTLTFRHSFNTEAGWDGGLLEISIAGGDWLDFKVAGGTFTQNGYNGINGAGRNNPIGSRESWTGRSTPPTADYITTIAQFPAAANGKIVRIRFRFGSDDNIAGTLPNPGWFIDNVSLSGAGFVTSFACSTGVPRSRADFDGDGKTDLSIFRPSDGNWWLNRSTDGVTVANFGLAGDIPTPGDFDGDGKTDIALWRPSNGGWYRVNSLTSTVTAIGFGIAEDIPQAGDFDGDQIDDISVFRPSTGTWWRQNSSNGQYLAIGFGLTGDRPVTGDYDGDRMSDIAVFRPSSGAWYWLNSSSLTVSAASWGLSSDMPANADFDGDNKDDLAVFRPSDGGWYVLRSSDGQPFILSWGQNGDIPVVGDYNADGRDDVAVYRAGSWFVYYATGGTFTGQFGNATDIPIPRKHIP
jgi:hypothetical protein